MDKKLTNTQRIDALEVSMKELIGMVSTLVDNQTKQQQVKPAKSNKKVSTREVDVKKEYGWEEVEVNGVKIYKSGSFYYAKQSQLKDGARGWIASKQVKGYMTTKYNKSLYYLGK